MVKDLATLINPVAFRLLSDDDDENDYAGQDHATRAVLECLCFSSVKLRYTWPFRTSYFPRMKLTR